jgi:hypothetical protein
MAQQIQTAKVICKGGLDAGNNFLELSESGPGFATNFVNYEWGLSGGYRKVNGYQPLLTDFTFVDNTNAEGKIFLTCMFSPNLFLTARKQKVSNTYKFYFSNYVEDWFAIPTSFTLNSVGVDKIRDVTFNFNGITKGVFVDGANLAMLFDGATFFQIGTDSPPSSDYIGGPNALPKPSLVSKFKNTIFVAGDPDYPHLIAYSAPSAPNDWTTANGAGQIVAGFPVVQIKAFRDSLYVFGEVEIKRIVLSGTDFVLQDVAKDIGCLAADSVVEINGDLLFLSQDGFRPISATERIGDIEMASVSKRIQPIVRDRIRNNDLSDVDSVVVREKSQVRFFFNNPLAPPDVSRGIVGCIYSTSDGEGWFWGELLGFRTSTSTSGYRNGVEFVIHGDHDGGIYRQGVGNSLNGRNIQTVYTTPYLDFGESQVRKTMRKLNIFLKPEGDVDMTVGISYDWAIPDIINPEAYYAFNKGSFEFYGQATYGSSRYGGKISPVMSLDIQGSGFSSQTVLSTNDTLASFTIQGLIYEFSVDGRD